MKQVFPMGCFYDINNIFSETINLPSVSNSGHFTSCYKYYSPLINLYTCFRNFLISFQVCKHGIIYDMRFSKLNGRNSYNCPMWLGFQNFWWWKHRVEPSMHFKDSFLRALMKSESPENLYCFQRPFFVR